MIYVHYLFLLFSIYLFVDTPTVTEAQLKSIELLVNEKIREATPVEVNVYEGDTVPNEVCNNIIYQN